VTFYSDSTSIDKYYTYYIENKSWKMNNFYITRKEVTKIWKNHVSKNQEKEIINLYAFTRNTFINENVFYFFFVSNPTVNDLSSYKYN
jgi:hypothetical protein